MSVADSQRAHVPAQRADMTMTTVVLGFFSVMVAKELRRRHRKWPYLASTLLLTLLVMAPRLPGPGLAQRRPRRAACWASPGRPSSAWPTGQRALRPLLRRRGLR